MSRQQGVTVLSLFTTVGRPVKKSSFELVKPLLFEEHEVTIKRSPSVWTLSTVKTMGNHFPAVEGAENTVFLAISPCFRPSLRNAISFTYRHYELVYLLCNTNDTQQVDSDYP